MKLNQNNKKNDDRLKGRIAYLLKKKHMIISENLTNFDFFDGIP